MTVQQKAKNRIEKIKQMMADHGISTRDINLKQYNYELVCSNGSNNLKVLVYFGKKGVKEVLQGNDETEFYNEVKSIVDGQQELALTSRIQDEPSSYIGTDETGKGDIFGPLAAAAFYCDDSIKAQLINLGVRDSKDLSDYQIKIIAGKIKKIFPDRFDIVLISPEKYNELYESFKNLNKLLNWAHSKCTQNILERTDCDYVITDKFSKEYLKINLDDSSRKIKLEQTTKAERFTGVAAASILARNAFVKWFEYMKKSELDLPKGAGENVDKALSKLINIHGKNMLGKYTKLHFKTVRKYL